MKDDFDFSTIDFASLLAKSNNQPLQVLMMGSATKLVAPTVKTVFIEDLPEVSMHIGVIHVHLIYEPVIYFILF